MGKATAMEKTTIVLSGLVIALVLAPAVVLGQTSYALRNTTYTVQEKVDAHVIIEIDRTGDISQTTSIVVNTIPGTAAATTDFKPITNQRREFIPSAQVIAIRVDITNDNVYEPAPDKQFQLQISNPTAGGIITVATATITIQDDDARFGFDNTGTTIQVAESVGIVTVFLVRDGNPGSEAFVYVSTSDCSTAACTATPTADFTPLRSTSARFAPGDLRVGVQLRIASDRIPEITESVYLMIDRVEGGEIGGQIGSTVFIQDDDVQYQITGGSVTVKEATGGVQIAVTITRELNVEAASTIEVYTEDGTATVADGDYTSLLHTLSFDIGQQSAQAMVTITDDNLVESQEVFYIGIRNPTDGFVLSSASRLSVYIDDNESVISISQTSYTVNEKDTTVTIQIRRTGDLTASSSVRARTIAVSATQDSDYGGLDTLLNFGDGVSGFDLALQITNDEVNGEEDETFKLELYEAAISVLGSNSSTTITIIDSASLSTLAIILIAIGSAVFILLILIMILCCCAFTKPSSRRDPSYYKRERRDVPGVDFPQEVPTRRGTGPVATYIPDDRDERRQERPERRDVDRDRSRRQDLQNGGPRITELPPSNRASRNDSARQSFDQPPPPQEQPAPPQDRQSERRQVQPEDRQELIDQRRSRSMFNPNGDREPYWERGLERNRSAPNHYGYF